MPGKIINTVYSLSGLFLCSLLLSNKSYPLRESQSDRVLIMIVLGRTAFYTFPIWCIFRGQPDVLHSWLLICGTFMGYKLTIYQFIYLILCTFYYVLH